ncbi:hypothetical protein VTI74DRAFT_6546 [Chaetomium olivicolor]
MLPAFKDPTGRVVAADHGQKAEALAERLFPSPPANLTDVLAPDLASIGLLGMYHSGECTLHRKFLARARPDPLLAFSHDRFLGSALALLDMQRALQSAFYRMRQTRQMTTLAAMGRFLELEQRRKVPGPEAGESESTPGRDSGVLLQALEQACGLWEQAKGAYDEAGRLSQALQALQKGRGLRKVAQEWGIPKSTLHNRQQGTQTRSTAFESLQRLTAAQEDRLAHWVLTQEALGKPPTHAQIKELAQRILDARGDPTTLGKRWITRFLDRHPVLKTKRPQRIESARVNGATIEVIRGWFPKLAIPAVKAIKPANRYNMDEAGIMEGLGENGLVVGSAEKHSILKKDPGSRAWTSFIECISATGQHLHPLVIFKGKSVQQQWFPLDLKPYEGWQFTATENGWTTDETAVEWLRKIFIPSTTPQDPKEARLLILDGHQSHESDDFIWLCFSNNIFVLYLPPHCSHVLQPADLSVFSPLKTSYRKHLNSQALWADSTIVGKRNFLGCYHKARLAALMPQNILGGWKASGLWPISISKPLMSRLLVENTNKSITAPRTPGSNSGSKTSYNTYAY